MHGSRGRSSVKISYDGRDGVHTGICICICNLYVYMYAHPCQIASEMTGFVTMEASSIAKVNVANGVRLTLALTLTLTSHQP